MTLREISSIFEVREESDKNAGCSGTRLVGYARKSSTAIQHARGKGVQGSPGEVSEVEAYALYDEHDNLVGYVPAASIIPAARMLPEKG